MRETVAAEVQQKRAWWRRTSETAQPPVTPEPAPEARPPVVLEHVSKRLDHQEALHDLSLEVRSGELFALVGPSGCGKTTTVRLMCNLYWPTSGVVRVLGHHHRHWPPSLRERIGYMPQAIALYPRLTVEENLRYFAALYGLAPAQRAARIAALLELVELAEAHGTLAAQLSGGMRRRVALASALVHDPALIFVDEPTAGLDPALRQRLWQHFRALRDQERSLVVTTQYIDEADFCDRVAVLRAGKLVAVGTPEELRRRAFGGEVVEVHSGDLSVRSALALRELPMVHGVEQAHLDTLHVVVDVARRAVPAIIGKLAQYGVTVESVSERRPSFDEVFLRLTGGSLIPSGTLTDPEEEPEHDR
jgi:ABC-2 type transport system ATP-binding protein